MKKILLLATMQAFMLFCPVAHGEESIFCPKDLPDGLRKQSCDWYDKRKAEKELGEKILERSNAEFKSDLAKTGAKIFVGAVTAAAASQVIQASTGGDLNMSEDCVSPAMMVVDDLMGKRPETDNLINVAFTGIVAFLAARQAEAFAACNGYTGLYNAKLRLNTDTPEELKELRMEMIGACFKTEKDLRKVQRFTDFATTLVAKNIAACASN